MKPFNKNQLKNRLEFVRYAKKQRNFLVEFRKNYPDLFTEKDLKEFDNTIFRLYLVNKTHNIFEQLTFTPFKNQKQLIEFLFLNEQINPELLKKDLAPAIKSQIVAVDNIYKFFDALFNSPMKDTGIEQIARNYKKEIEDLSEEINSMFGVGQAKGVSGLLRRGAGLASKVAGFFSPQAGMVKEELLANMGSGVLTSAAMSKIADSLSAKIDRFKKEDTDIRNDIIEYTKTFGIRPVLQLLATLGRQHGLPLIYRIVSSALGNSPLAQTILAGLSTTTGMAVAGVAAGAAAATAGVAFGGKKSLEGRAQRIATLRNFQANIQSFFEKAENKPEVLDSWEAFENFSNDFPSLTIRVEFYKKRFNNNIQSLKKAILDTSAMLKPFYYKKSEV